MTTSKPDWRKDSNRVRPRLSLWAAAAWAALGLALTPSAVATAIAISTPAGWVDDSFVMLYPLVPVACFLEAGFHIGRFWVDRREWHLMDPKPALSPVWWLMPFPRPLGQRR